mmetsp:Transcript_25413/g.51788  ORF Transcript_25413/g.51788 Transcript_25413/m.51788 type:complete len:163 (-) Transcript_25413:450-938(-)
MMENDIVCRKAHSKVFESTQVYLQAVDGTAGARNVLDEHLAAVVEPAGSDVEVVFMAAQEAWEHCSCMFWGLEPQNMPIMGCFMLSELAWRCGTFGNWIWIGMIVQISDAGRLSRTLCGGTQATNIKRTCSTRSALCTASLSPCRCCVSFRKTTTWTKGAPR